MSLLQLIKFSAFPLAIGAIATPLVLSNSFWDRNQTTNKVFYPEKFEKNCYLVLKNSSGQYSLLYCSDDLGWINARYRLHDTSDESNKRIISLDNAGEAKKLKIKLEDSSEQEINFEGGSPVQNLQKELDF